MSFPGASQASFTLEGFFAWEERRHAYFMVGQDRKQYFLHLDGASTARAEIPLPAPPVSTSFPPLPDNVSLPVPPVSVSAPFWPLAADAMSVEFVNVSSPSPALKTIRLT